MDLKEYKDHSYAHNKRHPWEQTRFHIIKYFIKPTKKNNILDIGSGDAYLAGSLANHYKESKVFAIDINYNQDHINKIKPNIPDNLLLFNNLATAKNIMTNNADVVLLMDVLEHVELPESLLQAVCASHIDQKTTFVITVPAFQFLFSEHDRKLGHVKRYTLKNLTALLRKNNFKIIQTGYAFNSLFIIRLIQTFFEKYTATYSVANTSIENWNGGKILTRLLTHTFLMEFKISWYLSRIGIKIPGLSCYCICRYSPL